MTEENPPEQDNDNTNISFSKFLETYPPNQAERVNDLFLSRVSKSGSSVFIIRILIQPEIKIHCTNCDGERIFRQNNKKSGTIELVSDKVENHFLNYICNNCLENTKTFAITTLTEEKQTFPGCGNIMKIGEVPFFGPPIPSKVNNFLGADRDLFFKGRRSEFQGFGIGAFAYYRRVVENQKSRIFDEIIKVAKIVESPKEVVLALTDAKNEIQFKKSLSQIKDIIPDTLKIKGHSPLLLLHQALSEGVHELDDTTCLHRATAIRVILVDLAGRISEALKENKEITDALTILKKSGYTAGSEKT